MYIRTVQPTDAATWERMRQLLWPSAADEHARTIASYFNGDRRNPAEVLLALHESGSALGFAEVSIRTYAEGCLTDRVAYLEGWFVEEAARGKGVGTALIRAVEEWARLQGCTELASDAEIENEGSIAAHKALGFEEAGRVVCFRKEV